MLRATTCFLARPRDMAAWHSSILTLVRFSFMSILEANSEPYIRKAITIAHFRSDTTHEALTDCMLRGGKPY